MPRKSDAPRAPSAEQLPTPKVRLQRELPQRPLERHELIERQLETARREAAERAAAEPKPAEETGDAPDQEG
jgi:hypothetical protein